MCACPACCMLASCIRNLWARLWCLPGHSTKPVPQFASHRERQPRRSGRAHGMGSDSGRRSSRRRNQVDRLEGLAGQRETLPASTRRSGLENRAGVEERGRERQRRLGARFSAQETLATYQLSYMKHAPIGPTMALADVKPDGTVHIHTHNQNPQELRGEQRFASRCTTAQLQTSVPDWPAAIETAAILSCPTDGS